MSRRSTKSQYFYRLQFQDHFKDKEGTDMENGELGLWTK